MARMYLYVLFATFSITILVANASTSCSSLTTEHLNKYFPASGPEVVTVPTLHECVKKCRSRDDFKSFVYDRDTGECAMYYFDTATLLARGEYDPPGVVSYEKSAWHMGPCTEHTCNADERCYPTGTSYVCKKAVDVCFKRLPVDVCFRRYQNMTMYIYPSAILVEVNVDSLQACVLYCNRHHAMDYKTLGYLGNNDPSCVCFGITVAEFEQQSDELDWVYMPNVATYEKVN